MHARYKTDYVLSDLHREQLSIEHSMHDLDSAVGRLDNIFISVYIIIVILVFGKNAAYPSLYCLTKGYFYSDRTGRWCCVNSHRRWNDHPWLVVAHWIVT